MFKTRKMKGTQHMTRQENRIQFRKEKELPNTEEEE